MLDNDELIATRKLHGQDDGLYEETSDKNVVTEEDLEELNEVLLHHRETEQVRIAIKHILSELKQKDKRIKELKAQLQKYYNGELYTAKQLKNIEANQRKYFINKQKVKDKIEELTNIKGDFATYIAISERIKVLQELLEEK